MFSMLKTLAFLTVVYINKEIQFAYITLETDYARSVYCTDKEILNITDYKVDNYTIKYRVILNDLSRFKRLFSYEYMKYKDG